MIEEIAEHNLLTKRIQQIRLAMPYYGGNII